MRKAILVVAFVSLMLPFECVAQLSELVEQTDKSVFTVYTYDDYGQASGTGTGFFINSAGVAITNFHVLDGASVATVRTTDGNTYQVSEIIGSSQKHDLVKFRVDTEGASVAGLELSEAQPEKGESIFTIGAPRGLSNTVSKGIVSGIRDNAELGEVFQITAPISPGSSGSPVINMSGSVIGVATFQRQDGQNLNFAISAESFDEVRQPTLTLANSSTSADHYFINERASNARYLILNSIERRRNRMTLNFTYLNLIIGYGNVGLIWVNVGDRNKNMSVRDLETGEKYYASSSTLGSGRSDPTQVQVGEAVEFQVSFAGVPGSTRRIKVGEGTGGGWQFDPIILDSNRPPTSKNFVTSVVGNKVAAGKDDEAHEFLSDLADGNAEDADVYNTLGVVEYAKSNYRNSLDYFSRAIEEAPSIASFYFNKYKVYLEMGNLEDAIEELSEAIERDPDHGDYYYHKGFAHFKLKQWRQAIESFDNAVERIGSSASIYLYRGDAYVQLGNRSAACGDWRRAREKNRATKNRTTRNADTVNKIDQATRRRISRYCE